MIGNNHHYIKFFLSNELNALYISIIFRALAFSSVGIFVPLYLHNELGYGLRAIIYFYLIYTLFFWLFNFLIAHPVSKLSFKYILLISSPFYISYFVLLYFLQFNPLLFYLIPAIQGSVEAFFWLGFHSEFSYVSDFEKRGKEVGNFFNFSMLAGLMGPLIGGSIILFSGFQLLFVLVSVLLFGSAVPMFFSKNVRKIRKINWGEIFNRKYVKDGVAFLGEGGIGITLGVFWPIFVFTILHGYLKLGSLATAVSLFSILFTYVVAKLSDSYNRRFLVRIGSLFFAAAWFLKIFIKNTFQLVGLYLSRDLFGIITGLPFLALTYDKSKNRIEYFIMREFSMCVGRVLVLLAVLFIGNLKVSFIVSGFFSL